MDVVDFDTGIPLQIGIQGILQGFHGEAPGGHRAVPSALAPGRYEGERPFGAFGELNLFLEIGDEVIGVHSEEQAVDGMEVQAGIVDVLHFGQGEAGRVVRIGAGGFLLQPYFPGGGQGVVSVAHGEEKAAPGAEALEGFEDGTE